MRAADASAMPICPVCGHPASDSPIESTGDYRILRCVVCDLDWVDPMRGPGAEWYAEHAQYQKTLWLGLDSLFWNHRQFLRDAPAPGGRLLDVGCGSGRFLHAALRRGYAVTGLDFNPEAVQVARERFALQDVYCGTIADFRRVRLDSSFDVVTAFEVLEHVEAPAEFLREIGALVRAGGYFALSVPYRDRWPRLRSTELWDVPPHHLSRWSKRAITFALSRAGFQVLTIRTGWSVGEEIVLHYIRFGTIQRLFQRAGRQDLDSREWRRLATAARLLMQAKRAGAGLLGAPVNLVLKMLGATGLDMYTLAQKR